MKSSTQSSYLPFYCLWMILVWVCLPRRLVPLATQSVILLAILPRPNPAIDSSPALSVHSHKAPGALFGPWWYFTSNNPK